MREMDVLGVRVSIPENEVVVVLAARGGSVVLPIVIGPREGASIATAQAGIVPERPQTHDLMITLFTATGLTLTEVRVTRLEAGTFHAELVLSSGQRLDARPSDAIALALRAHCPVLCEDTVLNVAGVIMEKEHEEHEEDSGEVVQEFREFLETVEPEDFER
ncbi:bifunctional nuclease family protein [Georgenia sp. MJ173]|uniref:bifunctional nuclease family protein n=1 Tax=Georgenia sunbinii TaxID=3117728 RepID=UPI002F2641A8